MTSSHGVVDIVVPKQEEQIILPYRDPVVPSQKMGLGLGALVGSSRAF